MLSRLLLITNRHQAARGCGSLETAVEASLEVGARLIQLREKDLDVAALRAVASRLVPLAHDHGARLVLNGPAELANEVGADGLHRPADGPPLAELREIVGDEAIIGVSTHSLDEARRAARQGVDYITLSPIYRTPSKPGYGPPLGLSELERVCRQVDLPVFALAGVTPARVRDCRDAGAHGVAVMGGVMRADDPDAAVASYLAEL